MKWHYTVGLCWAEIVKDGVIKPATAFVPPGEKPIVWFSTSEDWDSTANKVQVRDDGTVQNLDRAETEQLAGGLVRIGVDAETAPLDWHALKELSGMSSGMAQGLYKVAIKQGSRPGDWWGTFDAVPRAKWLKVERYDNGQWVPVPFGEI